MTLYRLYVYGTISTAVDIEAESEEAAEEEFFTEGLPGVMFLNNDYPDEGEWQVDSIEVVS